MQKIGMRIYENNNCKSIFIENRDELLDAIRQIPHTTNSHGETSFGYSFELKNGSQLVIGQTDDDVSDSHLFWIKHYKI